MKFYADLRSYNTRYFSGLIIFASFLLFMVIRPLSAGMGFQFFEMFRGMFLTDIRLTSLFVGICIFAQINGYFIARDYTKTLDIFDNKIIFSYFNGSVIEIKYPDLVSIAYTEDIYKNFEFTLKTGEKKVIYATIKNKQQAFDLIQQRIAESKNV